MHIVEICRQSECLDAAMAKMRIWLDQNCIAASLFTLSFPPGNKNGFRLSFANVSDAAAFAKHFDGNLTREKVAA